MYLDGKLSKTANEINAYQSSVLFAVDRFCTMTQLKKNINNDSVVVFDRYVSSNMLHQGGKIHNDEELEKFLKWLEEFEFEVMKIPKPDKIFFLSVPPEISLKLIAERNAKNELKSMTEKDIQESDENHLRNAFETGTKISKMFGWEIIDCVDHKKNYIRTKEDISNEIKTKVNELLNIK